MALHIVEEDETFEQWLLVELNRAYLDARRGKRKTADEQLFELNEIENLLNGRGRY